MSFASSATIYFAQYIMNDLDLQGTLASTLYIVLLFGLVAALPIMMKIGKGNAMRIGLIISAIGYFMPQLVLRKTAVVAAMAVVGIGFGFITAPGRKLPSGCLDIWSVEKWSICNRNGKCCFLICK